MIRLISAGLLATALLAHAASSLAAARFLAPGLAPVPRIELENPGPKAAPAGLDERGRLRVGTVRALPKDAAVTAWTPFAGGYVARFSARSAGARGLRVRLALGALHAPVEVRARGDAGPVETMVLDARSAAEAWTPWTEGESQVVELFSPVPPGTDVPRVGAVLHFSESPFAKAAASCTLSTACTSGDATLDALIAERKRSVMRIQYVSGGSGFVCTATLIDTPRRPAPYVLTANHCIDDAASAASIAAFWFYESQSCENAAAGLESVQTAGGMQLVFTNFNVDSTLLLMPGAPPEGAEFAPVDAARMAGGESAVSISHPRGDTSRWADGTMSGEGRDADRPYDMYLVRFARGIIEGGSSGSGLFTVAGGRLALRGVLSQGPAEGGCGNGDPFGLYGRMDVMYPQMAQYIGAAAMAPDDAPNRVQDASTAITGSPIDTLAQPVTLPRRIDYAGDLDVFRFTLAATRSVSAFTTGPQDTVGTFLDANGVALEANDDAQVGDFNTGITRRLGPGTYYFSVGHWAPGATGDYQLTLRADDVDANYTALWWNEAESGWGINVNHQGPILFATLFTYDTDGSPLWLVMSRGERQADGSFTGTLHRTTGPAFNAAPWGSIGATPVGTMRLAFPARSVGTLSYTFNGVQVTKTITRQPVGTPPTCTWSAFDRSYARNFQDLWYAAPAESEPGWGVNLTHHGDVIFATLFTYAPDGRGLWLVMPEGARGPGQSFSGPLYRTTGPRFDASPWTAIGSSVVGAMTLSFSNGNAGTMTYTVDGVSVTKPITRQVFSTPRTRCES